VSLFAILTPVTHHSCVNNNKICFTEKVSIVVELLRQENGYGLKDFIENISTKTALRHVWIRCWRRLVKSVSVDCKPAASCSIQTCRCTTHCTPCGVQAAEVGSTSYPPHSRRPCTKLTSFCWIIAIYFGVHFYWVAVYTAGWQWRIQVEKLAAVEWLLVGARPQTFDDCVDWARRSWQCHYHDQIRQVLHSLPPDHVTTHGLPFWAGARRCPHPLSFDANNVSLHFSQSINNHLQKNYKWFTRQN